MSGEDENSSEGIVMSSGDEEVEGLSVAVEDHIFRQEKKAPEWSSKDTDWRLYRQPMESYRIPFCSDTMATRTNPFGQQEDLRYRFSASPPKKPYSSTHDPYRPPSHSIFLDRHYAGPPHEYRYDIPHRTQWRGHFSPPPKGYLSAPRREMYNDQRFENSQWYPHSQTHFYDDENPRSQIIDQNLKRTRPLLHRIHRDVALKRSHDRRDFPPVSAQAKNKNPNIVKEKSHSHSDQNSSKQSFSKDTSHKTITQPKRSLPKPISFKIKPLPSSRLETHPLDPLSGKLKRNEKKNESPERWSHDKYEERKREHIPKPNEGTEDKILERKRDSKGVRGKRSRSSPKSTSSEDNLLEDANHGKKTRTETKITASDDEKTSEILQVGSNEEDVHSGKEEETAYEEEVVEEEVDEDAPKLLHKEPLADVNSDEEDEELLGLRLKALTSALNMENREKEENAAPKTKKKRKPKHIIRRVADNRKKSKSPRKNKIRKSSDLTDPFVFQPSSSLVQPLTERPRSINVKSKAQQLTLFGEIMKNQQHASASDTRRYTRSMTAKSKKNEFFLKLMKQDGLDISEAMDLCQQAFETAQSKNKHSKKPENPDSVSQHKNGGQPMDNYDEIEMDLEDGEEGSDSNLVPPGTDGDQIVLPLAPPSMSSPYTPTRGTGDVPIASEPDSLKDTSFTVPATPSQESIWSMLERPVESENDKGVGGQKAENKLHPRIPSDEAEIDDDDLLRLRAKLLEQLNKVPKDEELSSSQPQSQSDVQDSSDHEVAILPSLYPYQAPTLSWGGRLPNQCALQKSNPEISKVSPATALIRPNLSVSSSKPTTVAAAESTSNTLIATAIKNGTSASDTLPAALRPAVVSSPSPAMSTMLNNTPTSLCNETVAAILMSNVNLTTQVPKVFKPQMSSTPALTPNPTPVAKPAPRRPKRRRKRGGVRKRASNLSNTSVKINRHNQGKIPNTASKQKPNNAEVLKPAATDMSVFPKTPHDSNPVVVKTTVYSSNAGIEVNMEKSSNGQVPSPTNPAIVATPKTKPANLKPTSKKVYTSVPQTVLKTATTLIKSNLVTLKRQVQGSSPSMLQTVASVTAEKQPQILLPRHQPVVINLCSSDEEDSVLSPTRSQPTVKNPLELHKNMLDAMIEQVRVQTTLKQISKYAKITTTKQKEHSAAASDDSETCVRPFTNATNAVSSPSRIDSSLKQQENGLTKIQTKRRNSRELLKSRNKSVKAKSATVMKSDLRKQKLKGPSVGAGDGSESIQQLKKKFIKLKSLIGKDEISYNRLAKIKDAKKAELKIVEDELKEMIHRVAAIKGKASRCQELVKRYSQQGEKIKDRLKKRNALRVRLKERIKQQYVKDAGERRLGKINTAKPLATQIQTEEKVENELTAKMARTSSIKQERLNREKQRLLAMEQRLAAKINKMKKPDGTTTAKVHGSRRVSLSQEVQSHLAKYQKTRKPNKPSPHDLSLSKITISSPVRSANKGPVAPVKSNASPVRRAIGSPAKINKVTSPKKQPSPAKHDVEEKVSAKITVSDHKGVESTSLPERDSSNDSKTEALRDALNISMTNLKPLILAAHQPFAEIPFSTKAWEKPAPECFRKWRVDVSETLQNNQEQGVDGKPFEREFGAYESPLRVFRSFRLNPFFRVKEKLSMKSKTFSHKIIPGQILCRYDLTGSCHDPDCSAQHSKQYELTPSELMFDLISYCPTLLGKNIRMDGNYENLVKLPETACNKIFGIISSKTSMSLDEKCILIASKVNNALGNKPPYTTIVKPRLMKPKRAKNSWNVASIQGNAESDQENETQRLESAPEHPDSSVNDGERYFGRCSTALPSLKQAVKESPHSIQLWLELAYTKMRKRSVESNGLELALHTMCLALEENPYVGELWAHYLGLLHHRKAAQSNEDLDEMVAQAVDLVPLSPHIWNQLFSWDCNFTKREFLCDQLISNLIKNVEREYNSSELPFEVLSRWLLQTVLQKVDLQLHKGQLSEVLSSLQIIAKDFSQQCRRVSFSTSHFGRRCLTSADLNSLWLSYINLKYFKVLPQCFYTSPSRASLKSTCSTDIKLFPDLEVCLHIDSKLNNKRYSYIHADLNVAIQECATGDTACLALLRERLRLEMAHQHLDIAITTCQTMCRNLSGALLAMDNTSPFFAKFQTMLIDTTITWADLLVKNGDCLEATQVLDSTVTANPYNPRLCYEAALFQLNLDTVDVEAALLYFETCASACLRIEKDNLDKEELKTVFRHLLRLPLPLNIKPPPFATGVTWDTIKEKKAYLWLIYSLLLELLREPEAGIIECYEKAIEDVETDEDRKHIWLRYLRCRQMGALTLTESTSRQMWLKNFTSSVRRCLMTLSPELPPDEFLSVGDNFINYSFHNQVAAIYLSCFHTRQQMSTAYNFLVELMPYNIPLLLRASRYFLSFEDHSTVMSILWKVTLNSSCKNKTVWKISIASHFSRGRIAKAMHLSRRAVKAIPYSAELWSDYLSLLNVYGTPGDFIGEKIRCSACLQMDATQLLHFSKPDHS